MAKRKKSFNTNIIKNKLAKMQTIFNEFYRQTGFLIAVNDGYLHLSNESFRDLAVKGTVKEIPDTEGLHLKAVTSNNINIITIINHNDSIENYQEEK